LNWRTEKNKRLLKNLILLLLHCGGYGPPVKQSLMTIDLLNSVSGIRIFIVLCRVIPQIPPWIFTNQLNSSLNFTKYVVNLWIFTDVHQDGPSVQKLRQRWWCVFLHVVLSCTRVNKATTCTRTNLIEIVKIRDFTFQCHFFVFPIIPIYDKDRFDTYCDNLRTDLMDNVIP